LSHKDWYFIGFVLTVIAACVAWALAYVLIRGDRKDYLHRIFGLCLFFMGFWFLSGFAEKILSHPNNTFTVWTFRWANGWGLLASVFLMLFAIGLYLDRAPSKRLTVPIIALATVFAGLCCTPLVFKGATYEKGVLQTEVGPLFPIVSAMIVIAMVSAVYLITRKWNHSTGIDRARTSVVLYGLVIFVPAAVISVFIMPAIFGNDISSNYVFIAGLIPVGFTSYAVIRLRLLDTRIILRKTSVFIIGTVLLSVPVVLLFVLFQMTNLSVSAQYVSLLIVFMVIIFFAPDAWRRIQRLSSRVFFSELYDEMELLEEVSSKLTAQTDLKAGVLSALSELVRPLGLYSISVMIPPGIINDNCWDFECRLEDDETVDKSSNNDCHFLHWLNNVSKIVVTEELQRWPKTAEEAKLGQSMADSKLSSCVPIVVGKERVGYILVGKKIARRALSSTDIDFLEKSAEHFGLYVDNYALSTKLSQQLDELQQVYSDLHKAYDFKSEIIQVASHEFRTPITVISGFLQTLMTNWDQFKDEEKVEYMASITGATRRLMNLTDKFLNISKLEEGDVNFVKVPSKLSSIVQDLCSNLREEDLERLIIEGNPELYIVSDPSHLEVMLENIVENAFRFSPADQPVVLRIWRDSTTNYIQVQDFGMGIPLEEREKVFEPFVRLESLTHHHQGMGLGLHIVRLLSSRLGIEVEIDSGISGGTTVTLSFALD
jgi:signal transduction histidine kinase